MPKHSIAVIAAPVPSRPGFFEARLAGRVLCSATRTPFCDSARELIKLGFAEDALLVMRHTGADHDALRGRLGTVARLTVSDDTQGRPKFRRWIAPPASVAAPTIAPSRQGATAGPKRVAEAAE
jgi:hypothetical protein